ncbi:MAG: SDR family oxidoreductase [Calditrichaeota bacterium]|nr:SDR family oxidoreductase [Calditrichota bacterium]
MELKNKTALITGGAIRLGRAICLDLARAGTNIFCQYFSSDEAAGSLVEEVQNIGGKIKTFKIDLTDEGAIHTTSDEAINTFGRIDILVNNSALFYPTPVGKITEKDWNTFHELNLKAAFFLSQEVGMLMKKQGYGRIVSIGDISFESPWPNFLPYTLTKAGINTMTKGLAKALSPEVLVNCVNPGPVLLPDDFNQEQIDKALERTLLKKEGSADDIAKTVRFLIESDYITGASIPVDGGRHIG